MIQKGVPPDSITYNALMDGYCLTGKMDRALEVLNTMRSNEIWPDCYSYNILINGYCKRQELDKAISLLRQMSAQGLKPESRKLEEARNIFDKLALRGLQPIVITHNIMIKGLCQEGLFEEAKELFSKMETSICLPDDVTYNTIIRGSLLNKRYEEAAVLIENMRARKFSEDASTTSMVLDLLSKEEQDPSVLAFCQWFLE
ncbi:hypothetical protein DCAR_0933386 [Daucus carota subsp. sativus]|uniref:Pentacotripeptide-repeat region of PRORP domain-containing protein n=1 Tax=Daucus carota subsp. sativus TaxID=79200 RepID=A0AAF0XTC2_DAUCS|nr:hypothetical protein DCAR_0933386 [Daucus carota subsp. sativus]